MSGLRTSAPRDLCAALATFAAGRGVLARPDAAAQALAAGTENRVWRVVSGEVDWVVRLGGARDARLAVDRRREVAAAKLAAAHGFAPRIVHAAAESGLLVTVHVAGAPWSRAAACSSEGIARMGARLRALHAVPVPAELPCVSQQAAIETYLALDPPASSPLDRARMCALAPALLAQVAPSPRALCHHDVHHRNVIDSGELVFVDWEYAGRGEPLLDLAAFAAYHDFDAGRRAALRAAYAAGGVHVEPRRFDAAMLLFDCVQALWYDAADAWHTLAPQARAALVARLHA